MENVKNVTVLVLNVNPLQLIVQSVQVTVIHMKENVTNHAAILEIILEAIQTDNVKNVSFQIVKYLILLAVALNVR